MPGPSKSQVVLEMVDFSSYNCAATIPCKLQGGIAPESGNVDKRLGLTWYQVMVPVVGKLVRYLI